MSDDETELYSIDIKANAHGWEQEIRVEVRAENQWAACRMLGEALTKLVAAQVSSATTKEGT